MSAFSVMAPWHRDPRVVQLARDLGLPAHGNCVSRIYEYAIARVETSVRDFPVRDLDGLRKLLASRLSLRLEFVTSDSDIGRIAREHRNFHPTLEQRLRREFLDDETEGITLERDGRMAGQFSFLAVIDARGPRQVRSYFTAWHEIAHLLIHPPQLSFPGFRRSPPQEEIPKDPVESVVDSIAGAVAFYRPFFEPALRLAIQREGGVSFRAIERARQAVAQSASLFAASIGSINCLADPTLLVSVAEGLKKAEVATLRSGQATFDFAEGAIQPKLRVRSVVPNAAAKTSKLAIRRNMRVPNRSALAAVCSEAADADAEAQEDQNWWETTAAGHLAALPIRVVAARRGRFVYGLISA